MHFEVLHSIHDIDAAAWDAVLGPHDVTHSHAYAAAMEAAGLQSCTFRYVVARDVAGRVLAHANIYSIATPFDIFLPRNSPIGRLLRILRRGWPQLLMSRVVECGSPVALGRPLACPPTWSQDRRRQLAGAVHMAMRTLARDTRANLLVVRDFAPSDDEDGVWQGLLEAGYVAAPHLEDAVLDVPWPTFAGYAGSLRSHYRRQVRLQRRKAERAHVRRTLAVDFAPHAERLAALWQAVADRSKTRLREHLTREYFLSVSRHLGKRAFVSLFWRGDTIVAFTLYFDNGDVLVPLYIGIDYAHNADAALVFNVYQDWIETAIARGYTRLEMGLTAYEPKLRLGAHLQDQRLLLRHRNGWLTRPVAWLYRRLTPRQTVLSRHVFNPVARAVPSAPAPVPTILSGRQYQAWESA